MVSARVVFSLALGAILVVSGTVYLATTTASGTVLVQVRDIPTTWAHLNVTFSEIAVHRADGGNESGWVSLHLLSRTVDLMALGNLATALALDRVAPGMYTQLRIVVSSALGILPDGYPVTFLVPDEILKASTPFEVRGGGTTTVTLDFQVSHAVHPSASTWVFNPVIGSIEVR